MEKAEETCCSIDNTNFKDILHTSQLPENFKYTRTGIYKEHSYSCIYKKRKTIGKKCCVPNCVSTQKTSESETVSFHILPKNKNQALRWVTILNIQKPVKMYSLICSKHFDTNDFYRKESMYVITCSELLHSKLNLLNF